ncbi:MAG: hypothetical protein VXB01_16915, partial [Opitutae bacterium]
MFLLRKYSVTALASAALIAFGFYFYDHRRSAIPEYIPSPEKAEEITLLGAKTDASRFAPASEIKKRVSGQTKT